MTTHYWSPFSFSNMYMPDHELVFDHRQFPKGPICFDFGNRIFTEFPWIGSNLLHPVFSTPSLRALHHPSFQVVTISSQVMIHIVTTLLGWWSCMLAVFLATVQSTLPNNPKTEVPFQKRQKQIPQGVHLGMCKRSGNVRDENEKRECV